MSLFFICLQVAVQSRSSFVDAAIRMGVPAVWMQLGIVHEEAAHTARVAGLDVVMDRCTAIEHRRLVRLGKFNLKQT